LKSATDHDGISPGILRLVWDIPEFEYAFTRIIPFSLASGFVSKVWKPTIIHPIPKATSTEYCPASLLPQFRKVCERIVEWLADKLFGMTPCEFGC
jgi:hypothetical protein